MRVMEYIHAVPDAASHFVKRKEIRDIFPAVKYGCEYNAMTRLRIVSYNIRHGLGVDERLDLSRIAAVLRKLNPDLVALQELDRDLERSDKVDQMKVLGGELGMDARFKQSCFIAEGEYGIGVLSRFPIVKAAAYTLSQVRGRESRSALEAQVNVPGVKAPVSFLSIHGDYDDFTADFRVREIQALLGFLSGHENPLILAGDFNAERNDPALQVLEADGWAILDKRNVVTFPSAEGGIEIDHIALKNFHPKVVRYEVVDERVASDHFPIVADLELEE